MAQTDTDQEGESVRGGLNSRLKKLLVLIPLAVWLESLRTYWQEQE